jgi:biopolymer transport protein ExbD
MDLIRLRTLLAAPLASLFLVLLLCALPTRGPASVGINVPMTRVREIPSENCFSGLSDRDIVLHLKDDGSTWINETRLRREEIRERMSRIYENRAERIAFMLVDPNVSYGEFADVYDQAASSTPGLHIGLLTRQLREHVDHCPPGRGCTIEWAHEPGNIFCKNMYPPVPVKTLRFPGR